MAALEKLAKGRAIAVRRAPYFCTMIYSLVPIEAPGCGTLFVTPQLVMGYDPEYVKSQSEEVIAGCLVHEANHPLRQSHQRLPGGDPYLKNLAADIPINEDLRTAGFELPQGVVYASTYGMQPGKTMEEYYEVLEKLQEQGKLPQHPPGVGAGQCGGIGGNSSNQQLEDELDQQHGRSQADVKAKQKQAAEEIKQHQQQGRGHFSSDMTEAIEKMDGPAKVPWHQELSHILKHRMTQMAQGATDYSMSRPSNRTFARNDGIIRPGLVAYKPEVMVCLDTSGSMGPEQLGTSFRELVGVIQALPHVSHVQFMEADSDKHSNAKDKVFNALLQMA
jgi:predicted metal-dependent peptidase